MRAARRPKDSIHFYFVTRARPPVASGLRLRRRWARAWPWAVARVPVSRPQASDLPNPSVLPAVYIPCAARPISPARAARLPTPPPSPLPPYARRGAVSAPGAAPGASRSSRRQRAARQQPARRELTLPYLTEGAPRRRVTVHTKRITMGPNSHWRCRTPPRVAPQLSVSESLILTDSNS